MKRNTILALVAILAGGGIYLMLRDSLPSTLQHILGRETGWFAGLSAPSWFIYSFPDGLWSFAFSLLISTIWSGHPGPARVFWLATIPVFVLGFEFLQLFNIIPGTFCLVDLAFCATGIILGMKLGASTPGKTDHKKTI